jgi:hypothetical protein
MSERRNYMVTDATGGEETISQPTKRQGTLIYPNTLSAQLHVKS